MLQLKSWMDFVFLFILNIATIMKKSTLHQRLQLWSLQAPCVGASQVVTPHPHLARLPDSQAKPMSFFFSAFSESSHHKDRVYSEVCDNSLEHSARFSDIWLGMWSLTGKEVTVLRHSCSSDQIKMPTQSHGHCNRCLHVITNSGNKQKTLSHKCSS